MTLRRLGWFLYILFCFGCLRAQSQSPEPKATVDWRAYGGDADKTHYSPLSQINKSNVNQLEVAWSYDTQEIGGLQTSPIEIDGTLYGISPSQKVFAVDAETGKLKWKFDSGIVSTQPNRGLAYWVSPDNKDRRIIVGVMNFVYELNAETGQPIATFGDQGRIDLREGLGRDVKTGFIALTSPAVVYKDLFIVGGRLPETLPALPGDIRAYDIHTGKQRWIFHTIPHPGEFGYDTWPKDAWQKSGSANNWTGMTVDQKTGIVYVPTGSAAFDFYGGDRLGDDLFADCELALNAENGKRIWHFQAVHHDIWDRDFPSPPALITVEHDGKKVDAVAQTTKQGFVYVFDRATGKPLFPVEYRKYPPSDLHGEVAAAEQPLPTKPAPYARQLLTEDMLTNRTPEAHAWVLQQFRTYRSEGQFVPLSAGKNTVIFPGFDGGAEWGGPAYDPTTGILYVNSNEMAWAVELAENTGDQATGKGVYQSQCTICHRDDMKGSPPLFPSLVGIQDRMTLEQIADRIRKGGGRMPGFPNLTADEVNALVKYLTAGENKELSSGQPAPPLMRYRFSGYTRFHDPDGYPAVAPPWGTLNAINLNTGDYAWKVPLGEYPELAAQGMKNTGSENYGGPIVTAGGLLFIGATNYDKKFRVFDKSTGELLWETTLPFSGNATPITYEVNGKQYVVIAAGGGKDLKSPSGGVYVAFALKSTQ
ncbi:MAG TPA: PQQ-binding-like beta-propeller repeat protein [Terriglobales bacterium]|nr:PQQ-binding-like beta-propeller repeat protein [Terriglobales bacterium]